MPRFPQNLLEEVKARLPVSQLVGRRVRLKRAGRELRGLSPFNKENTPSFYVNDEKQSWFDHSAGKHGDIFDWMREAEGLEFVEAVTQLAAEAGIAMPDVDDKAREEGERRDALRLILQMTTELFERELAASEPAKLFAASRGLDHAALARWRIGYAPDREWHLDLKRDLATLDAAGLIVKIEDGHGGTKVRSRFVDRLMFPIMDARGRVVGFSGRALGIREPKYLNGPETEVFKKGELLYGAHLARPKALAGAKLVMVEGYLDAISIDAVSDKYAAAAVMGTAIGEEQLRQAWRCDHEPILFFDGDAAGQRAREKAALAALPLAGPTSSLSFAACPLDVDPDDLARKEGREALEAVLDGAEPLARVAWRALARDVQLDRPEGRAELTGAVESAIAGIKHEATRTQYQDEFARALADTMRGREPEVKRPRHHSKFGAVRVNDQRAPSWAYEWLIKGIAPAGELMLIMGRSGSGKSFETIDMAMSIARGSDFAGRKTRKGGVLYCFYEAQKGARKRVDAYFAGHGVEREAVPFTYLTGAPNLFTDPNNARALAADANALAAEWDVPLAVIVIDTHNAATRGAGEVKSEEISRILDSYHLLRRETRAAVWIVGHTNTEGRHRGNEQIYNNIETALEIATVEDKRSGVKHDEDGRAIRRATLVKQREGEDGVRWDFVLKRVKVGVDAEGDEVTSCISAEPNVAYGGQDERRQLAADPNAVSLSSANVTFFKALLEARQKVGTKPPPELGLPASVPLVVTHKDMAAEYRARIVNDEEDTPEGRERFVNKTKQAMRRAREFLKNKSVIGIHVAPAAEGRPEQQYIWPTGRPVIGVGLWWPRPEPQRAPEPDSELMTDDDKKEGL